MGVTQDIRDLARFEEILNVLFKHEFGYLLERLRLKEYLPASRRFQAERFIEKDTQPERIRMVFEDLGGAFIKLGQLLSIRQDLIPKEFCDEFRNLQDNVRPFPFKKVQEIIEREYKKPLSQVFRSISQEPVAAASIGQVHEATLKTGEKVVVKVKRPGIEKTFRTDIDIMFHFAELIDKHYPVGTIEMAGIVKEFERYTEEELDYAREAHNIQRFYTNFLHDPNVKIPRVYWSGTTADVIMMERIEGTRLSALIKRADPDIRKKVLRNLVNAVFRQIFEYGFFHGDPHPGNIFVIDSCRIAFLDFGIVGVMHPKMREKMSWLFINVIEGDLDGITDAIMDLNMMEGSIDKEVVKQDLFDSLGEYYNTELSKIRLGEVFHKLVDLTRKDNVRLPKDFVLLGKAIITLEGVALTLDKKFNLVKEARPYVKKAIERRTSPQAIIKNIRRQAYNFREFIVNIPERASEFVRNFREADVRLQTIDKDLRTLTVEIDRSSNRVSYGLLITGFLITGALTFSFDQVQIAGISAISFVSFSAAGILGFMLITSILRENR